MLNRNLVVDEDAEDDHPEQKIFMLQMSRKIILYCFEYRILICFKIIQQFLEPYSKYQEYSMNRL